MVHSDHDERDRDGRELSLWLPAPVPSRLQNELAIGQRKGAAAGLPKGAVWRRMIFPTMHSDDVSKAGKAAWKRAWLLTDERACIDGPVRLRLDVYRSRPVDHVRGDGMLTPKGERTPLPTTKPDVSNYLKICEDALKGLAFGDDAVVVEATVTKRWCAGGQQPGAWLTVTSAAEPTAQLPLALTV